MSAAPSSAGGYTLISTELLAQLLEVGQSPCEVEPLPPLRNVYYGLRHGQSEANVEGIISSDPAVGTVRHGLTADGRLQARRAATRLLDLVGRGRLSKLHFYSSDFTRAWQTAEEALRAVRNVVEFEADVCRVDGEEGRPRAADGAGSDVALPAGVVRTTLLRERWFGSLDGLPLRNYQRVWPRDLVSAEHGHCGVESVAAVARRIRRLILEIEAAHSGCAIVLTSHADTLQIAQVYVAGADPRTFSQYRFANAEVRALRQEPGSLPAPVPLTYQ